MPGGGGGGGACSWHCQEPFNQYFGNCNWPVKCTPADHLQELRVQPSRNCPRQKQMLHVTKSQKSARLFRSCTTADKQGMFLLSGHRPRNAVKAFVQAAPPRRCIYCDAERACLKRFWSATGLCRKSRRIRKRSSNMQSKRHHCRFHSRVCVSMKRLRMPGMGTLRASTPRFSMPIR